MMANSFPMRSKALQPTVNLLRGLSAAELGRCPGDKHDTAV